MLGITYLTMLELEIKYGLRNKTVYLQIKFILKTWLQDLFTRSYIDNRNYKAMKLTSKKRVISKSGYYKPVRIVIEVHDIV